MASLYLYMIECGIAVGLSALVFIMFTIDVLEHLKKWRPVAIVTIALCGASIFMGWCYSEQLEPIGQASEREACRKAGYESPNYRSVARGKSEFFCADQRGEIHAVLEPKCSTRNLENCAK